MKNMLKNKEMQKHFEVDDIFCDTTLTPVFNRYHFDIFKFDDWCRSKHNYTKDKHGSLLNFVHTHFGENAVTFIKSLVGVTK